VRRHVLSQLLCLGRHTVTGILGTSGRLFEDWSADYRMYSSERVDCQKLFGAVRRTLSGWPSRASGDPVVVALDDTRLRKSGRKTHGVKYTRDPMGPPFHVNFIRAQRFLQISMASPERCGMVRMIPIDFVHAPAPQRPRPGSDEGGHALFRQAAREMALPKVGSDRIRALRNALDSEGQLNRPLWTAVDGGYTNGSLLKHIPPRTVIVGRIRSDAKLYYLPESTDRKTGRKCVYGRRAQTPEELRKDESIPWQKVEAFAAGKRHQFRIKTIPRLRWRPAGKEHDLRLIVVAPLGYRPTKNSRLLYRRPAYLICTDPDASREQILQVYLWRWDIEVNFRDEKTLLKIGQAQVRHQHSVENVPALAVAAYAMLLTAATTSLESSGKYDSLPPPKWRSKQIRLRPSTQSLIQRLRHEVWGEAICFPSFQSQRHPDTKPQKLQSTLHSALFYANS